MISFQMCQNQTLCLQQELVLVGGTSQSVFVKTEKKLEETKYQHALGRFIQSNYDVAEQYVSTIDFLFCESFPSWKKSCFEYYKTNKNSLKHYLNPKEILLYDEFLSSIILELCFNSLRGQETMQNIKIQSLKHLKKIPTKVLITGKMAKDFFKNPSYFKVSKLNNKYWLEIDDRLNLTDKNYEN
ncbi:MAG: hypothetical protein ACTSXG_03075 [Alphaproteobacteria bacterium]